MLPFGDTILVVAAHPDDEVLGCGGTIARAVREGRHVHIAILGEGATSRYHQREAADAAEVEQLAEQSERVRALLGAETLDLGGFPDNRFDTMPLLDVVKYVESLVERYRPDTIFTQHGGDLNIDHSIVFRATLTATRPVAGDAAKRLYAYEAASSTEWAYQRFDPMFRPSTFVDIAETLPMKVQAMALYDTEAREFPHPRSAEALEAMAKRWGSVAGCPAVEAFELIREIC
ncbi:PIG-L family deacetylase [bacterium]|nr:PIG-L family deacetylase [bacterium]